MSRVYRERPEREELFDRAVEHLSGHHIGPVLFAPHLSDIIGFTGISKGTLARDQMYPKRIETITGLQIVHNGLVLADTSMQSPVEALAARANQLSEEDRARLVAQIALGESQ